MTDDLKRVIRDVEKLGPAELLTIAAVLLTQDESNILAPALAKRALDLLELRRLLRARTT